MSESKSALWDDIVTAACMELGSPDEPADMHIAAAAVTAAFKKLVESLPKSYRIRGRVKANHAPLKIRKGDAVWLSWTPEGGGWFQWSKDEAWAREFEGEAAGMKAASGCPGPWYYETDPASVEAVSVLSESSKPIAAMLLHLLKESDSAA